MKKQFELVVCGGTFDLLHAGHKAFLRYSFSIGEKVVIGLTTDAYTAASKFDAHADPYTTREKALHDFLLAEGLHGRFEITPIDSVYIPQLWEDAAFEAIVVTEESQKGAALINKRRMEQGKIALPVIVRPLETGEDGLPISSTRIREGVIDREGNVYLKPAWVAHDLLLPVEHRSEFKKPLGEILSKDEVSKKQFGENGIISVGDVTAQQLLTVGITQQIAFVDFIVERKRRFETIEELGFSGEEKVLHVKNPPGVLSKDLFGIVKTLFPLGQKGTIVVIVDGEEDLSALPLILAAPLGAAVLYGQPGVGTVFVQVTEESKAHVQSLIRLFHFRHTEDKTLY